MGAQLRNIEGFKRRLAAVPVATRAAVRSALEQNAVELRDAIARACDDDPKLSASVAYTEGTPPAQTLGSERAGTAGGASDVLRDEGLSFTVYAGDPAFPATARWREFGTAPHVEEPKNRQLLKFEAGGEDVFARHVDNPGERAQPFFFPTYRSLKRKMRSRAASAARRAIKDAQ